MTSRSSPSLEAPRRYPYGKGSVLIGLMLIAGCEGPPGADGTSCTAATGADGSVTLSCEDGTEVTVMNGADGLNGASCDLVTNTDGSKTITCPDSDPITVSDGKDGEPCTVENNGDGTATISCPGSTDVIVSDGVDGASCSVTDNGDGTQTVACTDGTFVVFGAADDVAIDPYLDRYQELPGLDLQILDVSGGSGTGGNFAAGDSITVDFAVTTAAGRAVPLDQLDSTAIWLSGPTDNFQHVIPAAAKSLSDVKTLATRNLDGTYSYTFSTAIPTTYPGPLNNTAKYTEGELTGNLVPGTYTVAFVVNKKYWVDGEQFLDVAHATEDVLYGNATTIEPAFQNVADANCDKCHTRVQGHGGRYRSVDLCVTCHTAGSEDKFSTDTADPTNVTVAFNVMIHKIHNAVHLPSVQGVSTNADGSRKYDATPIPYVVEDTDFSGIVYPVFPNFNVAMPKDQGYSTLPSTSRTKEDNIRKGVTSCDDCHGDPDGTGPLLPPIDGARAYTAPTRAACGSCHDDITWTQPYIANGQTMDAQTDDANCAVCHKDTSTTNSYAVRTAHLHPLNNAAVNPENVVAITALTGGTGTGGNFKAGDVPTVTFSIKDPAGANLPITSFDSFSLALNGPSTNRQVVMPGALTASPFDFTGRLVSAGSTTGKGLVGRVTPGGTTVSETLTVEFTSPTAYTLKGTTSGTLATGTLPFSASTVVDKSATVAGFVLSNAAVAQDVTIAFTSATAYTVTGSVSGAMGSGTLPATTSTTVPSTVSRFVSTNGSLAFNVSVGTVPPAAGNSIYVAIVKGGAANPVLVPVVVGRVAYAATDRFYYDYAAPAATYTTKVPMDLQLEFLGAGTNVAGQVLTAANAPVWFGRQTLWEQTAVVGSATALTQPTAVFARYMYAGAVSTFANNDYVLVDGGTANAEFARVSGNSTVSSYIQLATPLRFAHAASASIQEVTLTPKLEGTNYTLNSATGAVTLTAATTNNIVMTYRTDGRFGWKRNAADALQSMYYVPAIDATDLDETWGDWRGKSFVDGTYTVGLWGYSNLDYGKFTEWVTYRGTTTSARYDFLYGVGTTLATYDKIETGEACQTCHDNIGFHGGSRRGADTCLMCHAQPGPAVNFRTLLHEIHEEPFPVFPNGSQACERCHGDAVNWQAPVDRTHPTQQAQPAKIWTVPCSGCHTSTEAQAHMDVNTASNGAEACAVCHGENAEYNVQVVHRTW